MSDRTYDQFGHRFIVPVGQQGVAVGGTQSALTAIAGSIVQLPFAAKLTAGNRANFVGATSTSALVSAVIVRSVAGTGTVFAVGTCVWNGTAATGAVGSAAAVATGTAAEFAANDTIAISMAIGTTAAISTHSFSMAFEELFN